jgi:putative transposase
MSEDQKTLEIATFRFGIISEFVTGVKLTYGEKEKLISEKTKRRYDIPYSKSMAISRTTIKKWITDYKKAGFRLEGLYPKTRKDKGQYRVLDSSVRLAILELKKTEPLLTVPAVVKKLRQLKIVSIDERLNESCIYRFLKEQKLTSVNTDAKDRRRYEAEYPNDLWQSDVMYGPYARIQDINKKTYLFAIIDDHSRFIVHAEFFPNENIDNLKEVLRKAVSKRGLPQKFYVDNGSAFRSINLEQICALLGISLKHARPYTPQGKGKIERWFKTLQQDFLPQYTTIKTLVELNEMLDSWVDEYNNRVHSSIQESPCNRYRRNLECIRPAPLNILDYFRTIEFRRVKKDRSFQLGGILFEAPVVLIDKKIETRYHKEDPLCVEVFFNNQSFGKASVINPNVNSKIGRDWSAGSMNKKEPALINEKAVVGGKLFEIF